MGLRNILFNLLNKEYKYLNNSFSQEGEDLILQRIFDKKKVGFYVDVGAHHPKRFSNTYIFYKRGWRGINIDPMPGSMELFNKLRSRDVNLEIGISSKNQKLNYTIFNEPALNTFNEDEAKLKAAHNPTEYYILGRKSINTYPLSTILDKYVSNNQTIDFLSIDVEGLDFEVLRSNDWNKYRPSYILVEDLRSTLNNFKTNSELFTFFQEHGYSLFSKLYNTSIYKRDE